MWWDADIASRASRGANAGPWRINSVPIGLYILLVGLIVAYLFLRDLDDER